MADLRVPAEAMDEAAASLDPDLLGSIEQAVTDVPGVRDLDPVRVRLLGHRVVAELSVGVDPDLSVDEADRIGRRVESALAQRVPPLGEAQVRVRPGTAPTGAEGPPSQPTPSRT